MSGRFASSTLGVGEKLVLLSVGAYVTFKIIPPIWALILVTGILAAWFLYMKRSFGVWQRLGVPGPAPTLFFGNMVEMNKRGIHTCDLEWTKKYGKITGTYLLQQPDLLVSDVDLLKALLVKDFGNFTNRRQFVQVDKSDEAAMKQRQKRLDQTVLGNVITTMVDDRWKTVRNTITPSFTAGKLKQMLPLIHECSETLIEKLAQVADSGKKFDVKQYLGNFTMDVIASVALATKVDSQRNPDNPVVMHAKELTMLGFLSPRILFAFFFPWTVTKLYDWFGFRLLFAQADDFYMSTLTRLIAERRKHPAQRTDFLQLMLDAHKHPDETDAEEKGQVVQDESKKELTDPEIISQCFLFLFAGFETTASALQFVTYELATRPEIQQKCFAEIQSVLAQFNEDCYSYDTLQNKFPYLESVILETLRMYPPAVRFDRHCAEEYNLNGVIIPKNCAISVPVYVIHHLPEYYPSPEEFQPDRFSPENKAQRNPYTFLPFGYGPRNCIGMRFAMLEMKFVLVDILRNFKIVPSEDTEVPLTLKCTQLLKPQNPIFLKLEKRE